MEPRELPIAKERPKKKPGKRTAGQGPPTPHWTDPPKAASGPNLDDLPPLHSVERLLAATRGADAYTDPVADAQDLIYEAWESPLRRALALAKQALKISADCADAYCILARSAPSRTKATELYRQGVAAGERAIGPQAFEDDVGYFWGLLETRPYMRARAGLAASLWATGHESEAIEHYQDMLRLNPGDNQELRYVLIGCLLEIGAWDEAERLYAAYEGDGMASWTYARVPLDFQREGDTPAVRTVLSRAMEGNPHVPAYLLGDEEMPSRLPAYQGFGDESEAIHYVAAQGRVWTIVPGALAWLRDASS